MRDLGVIGDDADVVGLQMDVSMPFMGGMEATELIRVYEDENNLMRTPIIALTAHASMSLSLVSRFSHLTICFTRSDW